MRASPEAKNTWKQKPPLKMKRTGTTRSCGLSMPPGTDLTDKRESIMTKDLYSQMKENTVKADGQLKPSGAVRYEKEGAGKRILFVGNSITLHGYKPEIGWHGEWGMAASAKEKDYVHLVMKKVLEKAPDAAFGICQVSAWESHYTEGESQLPRFEAARAFGADIIILRFIENCPKDNFHKEAFLKEARKLVAFLDKEKKARFLVTTGFWRHPGDDTLREFGKELGAPIAELGDLGEDPKMKALGLFEHRGVSVHPGDLGMEKISQRIFEKLEPLL